MKQRIISFLLLLSILTSLTTPAFAAAPTTIQSDTQIVNLVTRSAGLYWGPVSVGNIEFSLTNPHTHRVGPYGVVNHVNLHIRNTETGKDIANYHIFKAVYQNGKECMIVWDSVKKVEVFRHCNDNNWTNAVTEFVDVVAKSISNVLSEANFFATVVIGGLLIVTLVDLVIPLDPLPLVPAK